MGRSEDLGGRLELLLDRVLRVGTYASVGLIVVGSGLLILSGVSPVGGGPVFEPGRVVADIGALRPIGFLWLGILGVLVTPGIRVLAAAAGLWRNGERRLAAAGALTLVVIAVGVIVGVVSG